MSIRRGTLVRLEKGEVVCLREREGTHGWYGMIVSEKDKGEDVLVFYEELSRATKVDLPEDEPKRDSEMTSGNDDGSVPDFEIGEDVWVVPGTSAVHEFGDEGGRVASLRGGLVYALIQGSLWKFKRREVMKSPPSLDGYRLGPGSVVEVVSEEEADLYARPFAGMVGRVEDVHRTTGTARILFKRDDGTDRRVVRLKVENLRPPSSVTTTTGLPSPPFEFEVGDVVEVVPGEGGVFEGRVGKVIRVYLSTGSAGVAFRDHGGVRVEESNISGKYLRRWEGPTYGSPRPGED